MLLAARDHRLANVVAFHPTVPSKLPPQHTYDAIAEAGAITAPVLVSYPSADTAVPNADFEALQTALQAGRPARRSRSTSPAPTTASPTRPARTRTVNADAFRLAWPQALAFIEATTAGH